MYKSRTYKNVLLIEPDFPIPSKSRNHSNFLPIGLLKIAAYLRMHGMTPYLIRFDRDNPPVNQVKPDLICVTSLFTYWSKYVKEVVQYYKQIYPDVRIDVGGIYATLLPEHCKKYTGCDTVTTGVLHEVEELQPAYDLVDVDYQILHTTRGCVRNCEFCGTYIIEPKFEYKKTIKNEIYKKRVIFYDNNFLANPYIKLILNELIELKHNHKINYLESQSGFDGRILLKQPELAQLIKEAGFKNVKIAWDSGIDQKKSIYKQIQILEDAGYNPRTISVFVLYNYNIPFEEMELKRLICAEWGVQINDCRYRPMNATYDNYNPRKNAQNNSEYYIHPIWTDNEIRQYRRNIRRHNICLRWNINWHSNILETKKLNKEELNKLFNMSYPEVKEIVPNAWGLNEFHSSVENVGHDDVETVRTGLNNHGLY